MTYEVNGVQYIAVNAGWNSAIVHGLHDDPEHRFNVGPANLVVFALDAKGVQLPPAPPADSVPAPPSDPQPAEQVKTGAVLYSQQCAICHGQNAVGGVKDLRYLTSEKHAEFGDIVLGGKLKKQGMESFSDRLSPEQVQAIHAYLISRAQEDWQPDFTRPKRKIDKGRINETSDSISLRLRVDVCRGIHCRRGRAVGANLGRGAVAANSGARTIPGDSRFNNQTVRQTVRVSVGGQRIRIRLTNEYGTKPLVIGAARVALADEKGNIQPGTSHPVMFSGRSSVTIPAAAPFVSDPDRPARQGARLTVHQSVSAGGYRAVHLSPGRRSERFRVGYRGFHRQGVRAQADLADARLHLGRGS